MVLLDTNIFVIDRFFPQDERYEVNKQFVARLPKIEAGFCIFSLDERLLIGMKSLLPPMMARLSFWINKNGRTSRKHCA